MARGAIAARVGRWGAARSTSRSLATAAGWFVRPAVPTDAGAPGSPGLAERSSPAPTGVGGPLVAVLGEDPVPLSVGAAVALALAGPGIGLLSCWPASSPPRVAAPAVRSARRLAGSLLSRGLEVRAAGRLVVLALPPAADAAVDAVRRAESADGAAARVLVLVGARTDTWDGALLSRDTVLVHGGDPAVADLAVARLVEQGADARSLRILPARPILALAAAGLALPGTLGPIRLTVPGPR